MGIARVQADRTNVNLGVFFPMRSLLFFFNLANNSFYCTWWWHCERAALVFMNKKVACSGLVFCLVPCINHITALLGKLLAALYT